MAKATTSKQSKTTKKPGASTPNKKPMKTEKKALGVLPIPTDIHEDDVDAVLTDPKAKGGSKISEDGEKALDPDLLIGDEPVAPVEPEEIDEANGEEEDEDAVIDPDEMNPFGDKWEE